MVEQLRHRLLWHGFNPAHGPYFSLGRITQLVMESVVLKTTSGGKKRASGSESHPPILNAGWSSLGSLVGLITREGQGSNSAPRTWPGSQLVEHAWDAQSACCLIPASPPFVYIF